MISDLNFDVHADWRCFVLDSYGVSPIVPFSTSARARRPSSNRLCSNQRAPRQAMRRPRKPLQLPLRQACAYLTPCSCRSLKHSRCADCGAMGADCPMPYALAAFSTRRVHCLGYRSLVSRFRRRPTHNNRSAGSEEACSTAS